MNGRRHKREGVKAPSISIVTASLNAARFIGAAMDSVLDQNYPDLEYVVVDGGSRDGTTDIIEKRSNQLAWWTSEPDSGLYDALNKGFSHTSGEVMAWLNADDMYTPWALAVVAEIFSCFPEIRWVTTSTPLFWDESGKAVKCVTQRGLNRRSFFKGEGLYGGPWYFSGWIQQESTFWRRSLWEEAGGALDETLRVAGDFELWSRFFDHAEPVWIDVPLGGFRHHGAQMSKADWHIYLSEARSILERKGRPRSRLSSSLRRARGRLPRAARRYLLADAGYLQCSFDTPAAEWRIRRDF